jgi:hypothetical protein
MSLKISSFLHLHSGQLARQLLHALLCVDPCVAAGPIDIALLLFCRDRVVLCWTCSYACEFGALALVSVILLALFTFCYWPSRCLLPAASHLLIVTPNSFTPLFT